MVARSKASVRSRSLPGIAGSNPAHGHGCLRLVSCECSQAEVNASG